MAAPVPETPFSTDADDGLKSDDGIGHFEIETQVDNFVVPVNQIRLGNTRADRFTHDINILTAGVEVDSPNFKSEISSLLHNGGTISLTGTPNVDVLDASTAPRLRMNHGAGVGGFAMKLLHEMTDVIHPTFALDGTITAADDCILRVFYYRDDQNYSTIELRYTLSSNRWEVRGATQQPGSFGSSPWNLVNIGGTLTGPIYLRMERAAGAIPAPNRRVDTSAYGNFGVGTFPNLARAGTWHSWISFEKTGAAGSCTIEMDYYNLITEVTSFAGQSQTSGEWTSQAIPMPGGENLLGLVMQYTSTDASNNLSKIEILRASDDFPLTTTTANPFLPSTSFDLTTVYHSGDFDNGFGPVNQDFKIKLYYYGDGTGTGPVLLWPPGGITGVASQAPILTVTNPSPGEDVVIGSTLKIGWTLSDDLDPDSAIDVAIEINPGGGFVLEDTVAGNTSPFPWQVPGTPGLAGVRLTATDTQGFASQLEVPFFIITPSFGDGSDDEPAPVYIAPACGNDIIIPNVAVTAGVEVIHTLQQELSAPDRIRIEYFGMSTGGVPPDRGWTINGTSEGYPISVFTAIPVGGSGTLYLDELFDTITEIIEGSAMFGGSFTVHSETPFVCLIPILTPPPYDGGGTEDPPVYIPPACGNDIILGLSTVTAGPFFPERDFYADQDTIRIEYFSTTVSGAVDTQIITVDGFVGGYPTSEVFQIPAGTGVVQGTILFDGLDEALGSIVVGPGVTSGQITINSTLPFICIYLPPSQPPYSGGDEEPITTFIPPTCGVGVICFFTPADLPWQSAGEGVSESGFVTYSPPVIAPTVSATAPPAIQVPRFNPMGISPIRLL